MHNSAHSRSLHLVFLAWCAATAVADSASLSGRVVDDAGQPVRRHNRPKAVFLTKAGRKPTMFIIFPRDGIARSLRAVGRILAALLLAGCGTTSERPVATGVTDPQLRDELRAMERADQLLRQEWLRERTPLLRAEVRALDQRHTARMKEIVRDVGWPGASMVGRDGAHAAWLLVQHANHDLKFLKRCLSLMEKAVRQGEASAADSAYLLDRVRVQEGKPQVYGTQFRDAPGGKLEPYPIENPSGLNERRRRVGLAPMEAYEHDIQDMYRSGR